MALRFQNKDEVDREAKGEQRSIVVVGLITAAITGAMSWINGDSLRSYEEFLAFGVVCLWALWIVFPAYYQIRTRTREIYGMVSETEKTVNALRKEIADMREQLQRITDKLDGLPEECELTIRKPLPEEVSHAQFFPELNGIHQGLRHLNKVEREMRDRARLDEIRARDSH